MRRFAFLLAASLPILAGAEPSLLRQQAGKYEVLLRLPAEGVFAREEVEIEVRISDLSKNDPVMGNAPVIRAVVDAVIDMPTMPGMPKIEERSHSESVAGDYGIHPVFAHAGEFRLTLNVRPPAGSPFTVQFPLLVKDADPARPKLPPLYRVEVVTNPRNPRAGQPVELQLRVRHRDRPKEIVTAFDLAHERYLHLVIVSTDLGGFDHEHPDIGRDGVFRLRYTFHGGDEYKLFADVAPKGAGSQVLSASVKVGGQKARYGSSMDLGPAQRIVWTDPKPVAARKSARMTFRIYESESEEPITDLEPYLGAMGHLMLVSEGADHFVHAHPDETLDGNGHNGEITFLTRFPAPGRYRGWVQVQRHGKVITEAFDVTAVEQ